MKVVITYKWKRKHRNENFKNAKAFINYSQTVDEFYKNLEIYNSTKKRKMLIVFNDMTADMNSNKKLTTIVTELFLRGRRLSIFRFQNT